MSACLTWLSVLVTSAVCVALCCVLRGVVCVCCVFVLCVCVCVCVYACRWIGTTVVRTPRACERRLWALRHANPLTLGDEGKQLLLW